MNQVAKSQIALIRDAYNDAQATAESAVQKATICGLLLVEAKSIIGHGSFMQWVKIHLPEINHRTAHRWMEAAERTIEATKLPLSFESSGKTIPLSLAISGPEKQLTKEAKEARQLFLDFITDKTLKALMGVVVDGDDAHRITRAHNGRSEGGSRGENRKDWASFIGRKLSDITTHLSHWKSYSAGQVETTETRFKQFFSKVPTPLLEAIKKQINDELKQR